MLRTVPFVVLIATVTECDQEMCVTKYPVHTKNFVYDNCREKKWWLVVFRQFYIVVEIIQFKLANIKFIEITRFKFGEQSRAGRNRVIQHGILMFGSSRV